MLINILTATQYYPNSFACFLPIYIWNKNFKYNNINFKFITNTSKLSESDVLIVDSKYHRHLWNSNEDKIYKDFEHFKKKFNKVIYFDTTDSTGSLQVELLDKIDKYWKLQIYKNKNNYFKEHFGDRIFTHALNNHQEFKNDETNHSKKVLNSSYLNKIIVAWNTGFGNYNYFGLRFNKIINNINLNSFYQFNKKFKNPNAFRPIDISARFNKNYSRDIIGWQRKMISEHLKNKVSTSKLSPRKYFNELFNSKISISPFGWGEIAYRDFETIIAGSVLIKPDMSHLETWPNFYQKESTYIPFDWNLENLIDKIEATLDDYKNYINIAHNAQDLYKKHTLGNNAFDLFYKRFFSLLY